MLLKLVHLVAPDCGCDRSSPPKPRSRRWPLPWRWPGRILSGLRQRPPTSAGCTPPRPRWRTSRRRSGSPHEGWTGSGRRGRDHATPPRHRGQCPSRRIRSRRQRPRRGGRPRVDQLQGAGSGAGVAGTDPAGQPDRRRRHRPQPEQRRGPGREDRRTHAATPLSEAGTCSEVPPAVDGRGDDPRGSVPTGNPLGWTGGWTGDDYAPLWPDHFRRVSTRTPVAGPLTRRLSPAGAGGMVSAQQRAGAIPLFPTVRR